jgi:hypothetical protein
LAGLNCTTFGLKAAEHRLTPQRKQRIKSEMPPQVAQCGGAPPLSRATTGSGTDTPGRLLLLVFLHGNYATRCRVVELARAEVSVNKVKLVRGRGPLQFRPSSDLAYL